MHFTDQLGYQNSSLTFQIATHIPFIGCLKIDNRQPFQYLKKIFLNLYIHIRSVPYLNIDTADKIDISIY